MVPKYIFTPNILLFLVISAFIKVGGYGGLQEKYIMAIPNSSIPNTTCGVPREDSFVLLRNAVDSDIPWPGFIFGVTASSIWYWCADQVLMVQFLLLNVVFVISRTRL